MSHSSIRITIDSAMYSDSAELRATAGCNLLPKQTRAPFRYIRHPVRERLVSLHEAQSESTEALTTHGSVGDLPDDW